VLNWIKSEPALVAGLVQVGLALAAAFGFKLTPDQTAAIMGAAGLILAQTVRASVTPTVNLPAPPVAKTTP
jgi:hypothetical protein